MKFIDENRIPLSFFRVEKIRRHEISVYPKEWRRESSRINRVLKTKGYDRIPRERNEIFADSLMAISLLPAVIHSNKPFPAIH